MPEEGNSEHRGTQQTPSHALPVPDLKDAAASSPARRAVQAANTPSYADSPWELVPVVTNTAPAPHSDHHIDNAPSPPPQNRPASAVAGRPYYRGDSCASLLHVTSHLSRFVTETRHT